ncbi:MAG: hypothetical protein ACRYGR_08655 [Janthinobacterium lividum]
MSAPYRMYLVSALLKRVTFVVNIQTTEIRNTAGWKLAADGPDAVQGRYAQWLLTEYEGFSIFNISVAVIPDEDFALVGTTP